MDKLRIEGGARLKGRIAISGAKNAALPLMATSLMAQTPLILENLPELADTACMAELLDHLGISSHWEGQTVTFSPCSAPVTHAPYDIVRKMRASVLVLGPLLARFGEARVSLPGGCAIGTRPVDIHIMAMKALGARVELEDGYVLATAPDGLKGGEVTFPVVSVGATENALMAAVLAEGTSTLINAAREPEITDLAECLNAMGAKITGHGSSAITVEGVRSLDGCRHAVVADRIEAGTFALAAAMTEGDVTLTDCRPRHLEALITVLRKTGALVEATENSLRVQGQGRPKPVDITTEPYPGFATDLQAQFMAMMCIADGVSEISETIFENRFMHVPELVRMGADIQVSGGLARVTGVDQLLGAQVMATDLRASVSLVQAGLVANGTTIISRVYHLDRGYDRLEDKLSACGARITRERG
jgi:UDP-N-acetylglucosamine 1-carboxyvinyltransferase